MGRFLEVDGRTLWIGRKTYPPHNWPLATLEVGESFFIPLENGRDEHGRSEALIRATVSKYGRGSLKRFHVHRVEGGLAVIRSTRPPGTRLR